MGWDGVQVQSVAWNPRHATVLLSGSFDKTAALVGVSESACGQAGCDWAGMVGWEVGQADMRVAGKEALRWQLDADVECLTWDPHGADRFVVSTEEGLVRCYDVRGGGGAPLFTLHAHDKATCAVTCTQAAPNVSTHLIDLTHDCAN